MRRILGAPISEFRKSEFASNTTDKYSSFHVYYSADDKLEAIEFFGSDIYLSIDSQLLFPGTMSTAKAILPDLMEYYGSYVSKANSVGISVEEDRILSVLVGNKGYYD